jgi:hypothetical protein
MSFDTVLSSAERESVQQYLYSKWIVVTTTTTTTTTTSETTTTSTLQATALDIFSSLAVTATCTQGASFVTVTPTPRATETPDPGPQESTLHNLNTYIIIGASSATAFILLTAVVMLIRDRRQRRKAVEHLAMQSNAYLIAQHGLATSHQNIGPVNGSLRRFSQEQLPTIRPRVTSAIPSRGMPASLSAPTYEYQQTVIGPRSPSSGSSSYPSGMRINTQQQPFGSSPQQKSIMSHDDPMYSTSMQRLRGPLHYGPPASPNNMMMNSASRFGTPQHQYLREQHFGQEQDFADQRYGQPHGDEFNNDDDIYQYDNYNDHTNSDMPSPSYNSYNSTRAPPSLQRINYNGSRG